MSKWTKMFDGRLDVHPPVEADQLGEVPARRGVVALLAEGDRPIVLMTAANIRARVRNRLAQPPDEPRKKSADLRAITRTVLWKLAGGPFETDLHFLELSRRIWPGGYTQRLAWRPAWFVHVAPNAAYPHFSRTRDVFASPGRYVGPFAGARPAQAFIDIVQDAFDLCRDVRHLRQAPAGRRCAYAQIGRCLCPCDGTIAMTDYRRVVARAADYAAGHRAECRRDLEKQMKAAAADLQFERAGSIKTRLERLAELDGPACAEARPAEKLQFILVQPGGARRAKVFLADRGRIRPAGDLAYPLKDADLARTLKRMASFVEAGRRTGRELAEADRWRLGLLCRYLFSSDRQRGVMVRWEASMTPAHLGGSVTAAAERLGLRRPKPRQAKSAQPPPGAATKQDKRERPNPAPEAPG